MSDAVILAEGLAKTYQGPSPVEVLKGVDLAIASGERVAFMADLENLSVDRATPAARNSLATISLKLCVGFISHSMPILIQNAACALIDRHDTALANHGSGQLSAVYQFVDLGAAKAKSLREFVNSIDPALDRLQRRCALLRFRSCLVHSLTAS